MKVALSLLSIWVLVMVGSCVGIVQGREASRHYQEASQSIRDRMEAQKMHMNSNDYQFVNQYYENSKSPEQWRKRFIHLVEMEPLQVSKMDETETGMAIEVQGQWKDYCQLMNSLEEQYPYMMVNTHSVEKSTNGLLIKADIFA